METKYIDYKYNNMIDNYTFLLNFIYFLHINIGCYISLIYVITFPFLVENNSIMNYYALVYCNLLINFINDDYIKMIYLDSIFLLLYSVNNDNCNIFIISLFYILSISFITLLISSLYLYFYIHDNVFNYIKYYLIGKPIMKYINNCYISKIYITCFYDNLVDIYKDSFSIG
jgi:hypothetical protein